MSEEAKDVLIDTLEAAADWHLRLKHDPSVEIAPEFVDWISDSNNRRAFQDVAHAMTSLDNVAGTPELVDLRSWALRFHRMESRRAWAAKGRIAQIAAIVLVAIGAGAGSYYYWGVLRAGLYETSVGERKVVQLADGSMISLDSDSEIHVKYTQGARRITLERGRARFDVAHDVSRPFTVQAGTETVVAVGTIFNVEKLASKVVITLIQGKVVVKRDVTEAPEFWQKSPTAKPVLNATPLAAGEELVAIKDVKPEVSPVNLQAATAWEGGHLFFRGERLDEAVEQINRYTDHPVQVDPAVADIRISGIFNAGDISSFVGAVTSYFPVQATTDSENRIVLQKKS